MEGEAAMMGRRDGQILVFAAMSLFALVLAGLIVYDVGVVVAEKIRLQHAADAAAMAGAQIEANAVSTIAWLNDGMAYVYYNTCRYAVDVGVYGTLAALKLTGPPFPSDEIVGTSDPVGKYEEAYRKADEWIPRGEEMLQHLSRIEAAIAVITPVLVEMEVYRAAHENGADRATMFPRFVMFPDPASHFVMDILRIEGGWQMTTDSGDRVIAQVTGEESWWISSTLGGETTEISVTRISENWFRIEYTDKDGTKVIYIERTPYGDIISEGDSSTTITHNPDGSTTITSGGQSVTYRVADDGTIEVLQNGQWVPIPKQDSVSVDGGPEVRVDNFINVNVGGHTWVAPNAVWIGNIHVVLTDPIRIDGRLGMAWIGIHEGNAVVNGLSTAHADGQWHFWYTGEHDSDMAVEDRTRHRMTEIVEGEQWQYEYVKAASYLFPDDPRRFVLHAIRDNDAYFKRTGDYPPWSTLYVDASTGQKGWFDMTLGRPARWDAYYQVRKCWLCHGSGKIVNDRGEEEVCPLCHGEDHDGDGASDVMVTQEDSLDLKGMPGFDTDGADRQSVDIRKFQWPLVLTEDFFKFGINVAVWGEPAAVPAGLVGNPDWGLFAVAGAKVGFRDPEDGNFVLKFPSVEDRKTWVEESFFNLYHPAWEFRMVRLSDSIRSEDIESFTDLDRGINYLYKGFAHSNWRSDYMASPDRSVGRRFRNMHSAWGRRFDISDPTLEEVQEH